MRFTHKHLRYFDAALRSGSIAKAAAEMNISQSSITAAIDLIEQSIGAELFRRVPAKGIAPTSLGLEVGVRVSAFLEQTRLFESDLMSLAGDPTGTLRLACYAPTAPHVLPPLLKGIAQRYPDIRIDLLEGDALSIENMLRKGAVDVALSYALEHQTAGTEFLPLFEAPPWALFPDSAPQAKATSITLEELAPLPMIVLDLAGTQDYFKSLFAAVGLEPNIIHTTKSSSVVRGLVAADFGYSLLNICGPVDRSGQSGYVAVPIADRVLAPVFGVAYTPAAQQSSIVRAVLKTSAELVKSGGFDHLLM